VIKLEKKVNVLYVYGWAFLNGIFIFILMHIYGLIFVIIYILYELFKHLNPLNNLYIRLIGIFKNFLINLNDPSKHFLGINNYLTVILFFFAVNEFVLAGYYYTQILSGTTITYEILLILSLIFSMVNIYFGLWVHYKMSELDEIHLEIS
jgi:hypothetical protein